MSNDLISRSALIKWIDDSVSQYGHTYSTDMHNMWGLFKDYLINNAPTITPDMAQRWRQRMNKYEAKDVLNRHLHHWEHLLQDKICGETEGKETIEALDIAIKALEDRPTGDRKCVTCKYCDGEIINKPCRTCSHAWADLYEEVENEYTN